MRTAGFVLAGGKSSRMGRDKALLDWQDRPLVMQVVQAVQDVIGSVTLVGKPERYEHLNVTCIPDLRSGYGPMSGIETALESPYACEWNLIVSCDVPDLDRGVLNALLSEAHYSSRLCIAAKDPGGQPHPLCALYRQDCLPVVRRLIDEQRLRLIELLDELNAAYITVAQPIANINTAEGWIQWQKQ